jgi:hypothetical protein
LRNVNFARARSSLQFLDAAYYAPLKAFPKITEILSFNDSESIFVPETRLIPFVLSHLQSGYESFPAFGKFDGFDIDNFTNDLHLGYIVL